MPPFSMKFWRHVDRSGECWLWTASVRKDGYAHTTIGGRTVELHRFVYELLVGPIPGGMQLDHACHTRDKSCAGGPTCTHRRCVNPAHLEVVSHAENNRRMRKGFCRRGHPYTEENTWVGGGAKPYRQCRACARIRAKRRAA